MRLLNTERIKLEEVPETNKLEYAILSHRWQENEVSLQDMQSLNAEMRQWKGYKKLEGACQGTLHITKPATDAVLVAAMVGLIQNAGISN